MKSVSKIKQRVKRQIHLFVIRLQYYASFVKLVNKPVSDFDLGIEGIFLVATKSGLYQIWLGELRLVLRGNFYGLSHADGNIYVFERMGKKGRILQLKMQPNQEIATAYVYMRGLSSGCHQIDIHNGALYICDTYNNRILEIELSSKKIRGEYYPLGLLDDGRNSMNYGHINSIYLRGRDVIILCHNDTRKTNRTSQLAILGHDFKVRDIIDTNSGAAHNVAPWNQSFLYCDSLNGTLMLGDKNVFKASCFTRGLSITKGHIVLGGSEYANRDVRECAKGYLFVLDRGDFKCLHRFEFPAMVQEIRRLDDVDFGLSASVKGKAI